MTSIDPAGKLLAYLREQAQTLRRQTPTSPSGPSGPAQENAARPEDAALRLARHIAAIDRDDPQARRKVFRLYLESVLLKELGPALANDPGFSALVDRVQDTMEADTALGQSMDQAGKLLLDSSKAA